MPFSDDKHALLTSTNDALVCDILIKRIIHSPIQPAMSSLPSTTSLANPSQQSFSGASTSASVNRNRQYTHLHAQLAQLNAHLADMENLVGMTAVQAEYVRGLGAWWGGG